MDRIIYFFYCGVNKGSYLCLYYLKKETIKFRITSFYISNLFINVKHMCCRIKKLPKEDDETKTKKI